MSPVVGVLESTERRWGSVDREQRYAEAVGLKLVLWKGAASLTSGSW